MKTSAIGYGDARKKRARFHFRRSRQSETAERVQTNGIVSQTTRTRRSVGVPRGMNVARTEPPSRNVRVQRKSVIDDGPRSFSRDLNRASPPVTGRLRFERSSVFFQNDAYRPNPTSVVLFERTGPRATTDDGRQQAALGRSRACSQHENVYLRRRPFSDIEKKTRDRHRRFFHFSLTLFFAKSNLYSIRLRRERERVSE